VKSEASQPDRTWRVLLIPVVLIQFCFFLVISRSRLIDGDEGFYLMASRLVFEHKVPYRDFFFTQMPLLPYVYGLWMQVAGATWIAGRALSAIFTTLLGAAMYVHVCRETGRWAAGLVTAVLFVFSTYIFGWLPAVKTFALSSLLLFVAYAGIARYAAKYPKRVFALGGLLLGLSADARLYFAGLLPLLMLWIFIAPEIRERRMALLWLLGGFAIAVLPNLYFLAIAPDAYIFGNIGIHSVRSREGLIGGIGGKLDALQVLLLTRGSGNGFQIGILFILSGFLIFLKNSPATRLAFYIAGLTTLISLMPTPSHGQYFCVPVPFLIVAVVCSVSGLLRRLPKGTGRRWVMAGSVILLAAFIGVSFKDFGRFMRSGVGMEGILPSLVVNYKVDSVIAMSKRIDEIASRGEPVMCLWPGYVVQTKASPAPGFENNTGRDYTRQISPERMVKFHIVPQRQLEAQIAAHIPSLVVVGNQESMYAGFDAESYERVLQQSGYRRDYVVGSASLWLAPHE
jgi:hypothetical protein